MDGERQMIGIDWYGYRDIDIDIDRQADRQTSCKGLVLTWYFFLRIKIFGPKLILKGNMEKCMKWPGILE